MDYLLYDENDILERVDEYSLYCLYLGYEPLIGGGKYKSPLRDDDDNPSFGIFEAGRRKIGTWEYIWKDSGSNEKAGNIFVLVQRLFGYETRHQALRRIMADTGIGGVSDNKERVYTLVEPKYSDPVDIQIVSRPFNNNDYNYWKQGNITPAILQRYDVKALKMYWLTAAQTKPEFPKGIGFSYSIYDKYQLYFPFHPDKSKKFRHNYTEACIHGFHQLQYDTDLLIITKSRKDVMLLRAFGYEAVSPRSENTMVPEPFLKHFEEKYPNRLVLFDNDGKHKGNDYKEPKIFVPKLKDTDKDPFDFCINHGVPATAEMLRQIIGR